MPTVLFNRETARLAGLKSVESRRLAPLRSVPDGYKVVRTDYPEFVPADNSIREARLARVRTQLALLDKLIESELEKPKPDGKALKDLTESQLKLAKQVLDWTIKGKGDRPKPTSPVEVAEQPQMPQASLPVPAQVVPQQDNQVVPYDVRTDPNAPNG